MKLDTSTIDGYAEMSAEDKVKAMESLELEDTSKLKNALSKSNSEAAEYKRKLNERLSAEEKAEAERAERQKGIEAELNALRREKTISEYQTMVSEWGMSGDTMKETATAMADGNFSTVSANVKAFLDATKKQLAEDALKAQPSLSTGATPTAKDAEDAEVAKLRKAFGL